MTNNRHYNNSNRLVLPDQVKIPLPQHVRTGMAQATSAMVPGPGGQGAMLVIYGGATLLEHVAAQIAGNLHAALLVAHNLPRDMVSQDAPHFPSAGEMAASAVDLAQAVLAECASREMPQAPPADAPAAD